MEEEEKKKKKSTKEKEQEKIAKFGVAESGAESDSGNEPATENQPDSTKHTPLHKYDELHSRKLTHEDGACLVHCVSSYREHSCSHRWQAVHRAEKDKAMYEPYGTDFRTCVNPWPNNAHHLLPVSTILNAIGKKAAGKPQVAVLIIQSLLTHKYNINHHGNMMVLPQQTDVSVQIGLPTHRGSHPDYNAKVESKLLLIMSPYESWTEELCEPPKEGADIVTELRKFSNDLYDEIKEARTQFRKDNKDLDNGSDESIRAMGINKQSYKAFSHAVAKGVT